jgi:opacity protein-like surface antigen
MIRIAIATILVFSAPPANAQSSLLYLEAQAVGGYSSAERDVILYSMTPLDAMQKPSVGFDWLRRLSGESRDYAVLGLQARLAYNHEPDREMELQIYNAWFKYKAGFADFWIGHDRPAIGLSSYFDSHGLLLPTLAMMGWGFDRDWGAGFNGDYSWGTIDCSYTLGSGMPIYFKGNHLFSARISFGVLEEGNRNLGFSIGWGDVLETMGYELMSNEPESFRMAGFDLTHLWARYESRFEFMAQERDHDLAYAFFWRLTMNLLEENRLKLEAQPVVIAAEDEWSISPAAGISYQVTSDLALRAMYQYIDGSEDNRIIFQVYYYKGV